VPHQASPVLVSIRLFGAVTLVAAANKGNLVECDRFLGQTACAASATGEVTTSMLHPDIWAYTGHIWPFGNDEGIASWLRTESDIWSDC
jgi:hypothetical protein